MSERKRATKGQFKKLVKYKKGRSDTNELKQYLSIIDDLHGKLLNPAKYPDISETDQGTLSHIWLLNRFDDFEKSKLWQIAEAPDWREHISEDQLQDLKKRIINIYQSWVNWVQYSSYADCYPELVESLHPATQKLLPKIVPDYQSPEQIRVFQDLETAYNLGQYSNHRAADFSEFREFEFAQYQRLAKDRRNYFLQKADQYKQFAELIREHAPITKEKKWPTQWMLNHKGITQNLNKKKLFIPILQCITDSAFHRTADTTKEFGYYLHENRNEYLHIVTKINTAKIADHIGASSDTVKKYIGAMKRAEFIKPLTNPYYALGYWGSPHRNKIFFLKETRENKNKLVNFSYR